MASSTPCFARFARTCSRKGRPATGMSPFFVSSVNGRSRVPSPPTSMTAFNPVPPIRSGGSHNAAAGTSEVQLPLDVAAAVLFPHTPYMPVPRHRSSGEQPPDGQQHEAQAQGSGDERVSEYPQAAAVLGRVAEEAALVDPQEAQR